MRGARPMSSSAVRRSPKPAPPPRRRWRRRPPSPRPAGRSPRWISSSLSGHSSDLPVVPVEREAVHGDGVHCSSTPLASMFCDEARDRSATCRRARAAAAGFSAAIASPASIAISANSASSPDRARGPSATCCWARSRSSPLRSCGLLCARRPPARDRRRARPRAARRAGRGRPPPPDGRRSRSRRCAASPRRRRGSGSTSWSGRPRSGAR